MIEFFVAGQPVPQGSARAFVIDGKAHITSTSGRALKDWRTAIQFVAQQHFTSLLAGPVGVECEFVLPRPKSTPRREARPWRTAKPDLDKALRAVFDALTGVAYADDAQVVNVTARKVTAAVDEQMGVRVRVWREGA